MVQQLVPQTRHGDLAVKDVKERAQLSEMFTSSMRRGWHDEPIKRGILLR
jgi:hypothetical protein